MPNVCIGASYQSSMRETYATKCLFCLLQVYINAENVDDYLIDSITRPADDPNAGEVYYRYGVFPFDIIKILTVLIGQQNSF